MPSDLALLVATQGGALRWAQAREHLGWRRAARYEDLGHLVRDSRSVARVKGAPDELADRIARVALHLKRPVIACHTTAAALHGFGIVDDGLIHVTTESAASVHVPAGVVSHQSVLRSPPAAVGSVLVTQPADTAVDVARSVAAIDVLAILDAALRAGVPESELDRALAAAGRRRGLVAVRRWLPLASPLAESPMESRTRYRVLDAGLPEPELQVEVQTTEGTWYRLDMLWRKHRVALEFDGEDFHTGDGSLRRDRDKLRRLLATGVLVVPVTAADVYRHPERFTGTVRSLLAERSG